MATAIHGIRPLRYDLKQFRQYRFLAASRAIPESPFAVKPVRPRFGTWANLQPDVFGHLKNMGATPNRSGIAPAVFTLKDLGALSV